MAQPPGALDRSENRPKHQGREPDGDFVETLDESNWKRSQLKSGDAVRFQGRAERADKTRVHGIIPLQFFAAASSECRELFIDGHFYGCVSLAQAVAEGLTRFLASCHQIRLGKDCLRRARKLRSADVISQEALQAFEVIWGNDRNTFHHLNDNVPTDPAALEQRAWECVDGLYVVESEVFAFDVQEGAIVPKDARYWPQTDSELARVHLRLSGH